jgi:hypothetical protein
MLDDWRFFVQYNLSLREIRALAWFMFGPLFINLCLSACHLMTSFNFTLALPLWLGAGYVMARGPMSPYLPDLTGKTALVTGESFSIMALILGTLSTLVCRRWQHRTRSRDGSRSGSNGRTRDYRMP